MSKWKLVSEELPPEGKEVIGYNPEWIDLDFNEDGTCLCFINSLVDWTIAAYEPDDEEWKTFYSREKFNYLNEMVTPTHWKEKPNPPHAEK